MWRTGGYFTPAQAVRVGICGGRRSFHDLSNLVCDPATLVVARSRVGQNGGSRTAGTYADIIGPLATDLQLTNIEHTMLRAP